VKVLVGVSVMRCCDVSECDVGVYHSLMMMGGRWSEDW
jgi:hypothetical protein